MALKDVLAAKGAASQAAPAASQQSTQKLSQDLNSYFAADRRTLSVLVNPITRKRAIFNNGYLKTQDQEVILYLLEDCIPRGLCRRISAGEYRKAHSLEDPSVKDATEVAPVEVVPVQELSGE